jgi:hypothetical protein
MDIPARVQILAGIRTGAVYYFTEESFQSSEPHYFIVLNKNPRTDELLILVCASSQVEKRTEVAKKLGFPTETLVIISPPEFPLFKKQTIIDCNRALERTSQSLIEKLEQGKLKICTELMPISIVEKLILGVLASSQVSKKVQQILSNSN